MRFDISDSNKKVLLIVLGLASILLSYFLGYRSVTSRNGEMKEEITQLEVRHTQLTKYKEENATYQEGLDKSNSMYEYYMSKFNGGYIQDDMLMFLKTCEETTGVKIKQIDLDVTNNAYEFGKLTSSNPDEPGVSGAPAEYVGRSTSHTLSLTGKYGQVKDALAYLSSEGGRKVLPSIVCNYDAADDLIDASITVVDYALYKNDGTAFESSIVRPETKLSKKNIFNQEEDVSEE